MVDATEAQCRLGANALLLTYRVAIRKRSLLGSAACTSGCRLQARCGITTGETSALGKIDLGILGAIEAALLAPAKEASGLAVLESILSGGVVALGACVTDAEAILHT